MTNVDKLKELTERFRTNLTYYKDSRYIYNERSCRTEYIDPLLKIIGWDVADKKGAASQYREVIAENYICALISRDVVYFGVFDKYIDDNFLAVNADKQPVDVLFLKQINEWRVSLSNELYKRMDVTDRSLEVLNDVVQEFISRMSFFVSAKIKIFHCIINYKIRLFHLINFRKSWKKCSVKLIVAIIQACFQVRILCLIYSVQ